MRRNSRGTPGVKKNRALPMSIAKPQAVPIGLSRISERDGSIACFRLFGDMTRPRRRKNSSIVVEPLLVEHEFVAGRLGRDLLRQIIDGRPETAVDDDRVGALAGLQKRGEQRLAVVADRRAPAHRQPDILELLRDIAEIGVDDLAGQDFVAGADDFDLHGQHMKFSLRPVPAIASRELPRGRQRDVGGAQIDAAEADIRRIDVRHLDLAHHLPGRRNHRDMAGHQRRDADIAGGLDRQTVETLEAGQAAHETAAERRREMLFLDDARLDDVEREEARAFGIGDIDGLFVRRQADPVRGQHRIGQLDDLRAVRQRVIQPAIVAVMRDSACRDR